MNESAERVGAHQAEQPKHEQNNKYGPQHNFPPVSGFTAAFVSHVASALIFRKKYYAGNFPLVGRENCRIVRDQPAG
jgi:hypothetical protein